MLRECLRGVRILSGWAQRPCELGRVYSSRSRKLPGPLPHLSAPATVSWERNVETHQHNRRFAASSLISAVAAVQVQRPLQPEQRRTPAGGGQNRRGGAQCARARADL